MTGTPIGLAQSDGGTALAAASWSVTLLGLGSGIVSVSPAIDNTVATIGGAAYEIADLLINLGASTALGTTGNPSISAVVLASLDGTNYMSAYAAGTQLYPLADQRMWSAAPSTSAQFIIVPNLQLRSTSLMIAIINNLGVALPASGVTATLFRFREQAG